MVQTPSPSARIRGVSGDRSPRYPRPRAAMPSATWGGPGLPCTIEGQVVHFLQWTRRGVAVRVLPPPTAEAQCHDAHDMSPGPPMPERELVERLCAGDPGALTQAYERYAPMVYRVGCRLLGETADAEDLVQDVFTGLPRAARSFEGRSSFGWWLNRVAARTALMLLRRHRAQRRRAERFGWLAPRSSGADEPAARMDLEHALQALDESHRVVLVLKEIEGYSHREIADLLGLSVGAARVRLHRARRRLQAYLEVG